MGLFSKFNGESRAEVPWKSLKDVAQLDEIVENSNTRAQIIFKHSTRCGISRMAMDRIEREWDANIDVDIYYLDLLSYRPISNEVALRSGVQHESPQMIIWKDGKVVGHGSHDRVGVSLLEVS